MSERYFPFPEPSKKPEITAGLQLLIQREPLREEDIESFFIAWERFKQNEEEKESLLEELENRINRAINESLFFSEIKVLEKELEKTKSFASGKMFSLLERVNKRLNLILATLNKPMPLIRPRREDGRPPGADRITDRRLFEYLEILDLDLEKLLREKILDLGCGEALFVSELSKKAEERNIKSGRGSYGIDLGLLNFLKESNDKTKEDNVEPLEVFKRKRLQARLESLTNVVIVGDWHHLPFASQSFDRVVSVFGFPFWVESWHSLRTGFAEILRVLKKGGVANLYPGAPVITPIDLDEATRKIYDSEPILYQLWHRPEYEEIIKELAKKVQVQISLKTFWPNNVSPAVYLTITVP
jgi:SAM-dependent methyltransferase